MGLARVPGWGKFYWFTVCGWAEQSILALLCSQVTTSGLEEQENINQEQQINAVTAYCLAYSTGIDCVQLTKGHVATNTG